MGETKRKIEWSRCIFSPVVTSNSPCVPGDFSDPFNFASWTSGVPFVFADEEGKQLQTRPIILLDIDATFTLGDYAIQNECFTVDENWNLYLQAEYIEILQEEDTLKAIVRDYEQVTTFFEYVTANYAGIIIATNSKYPHVIYHMFKGLQKCGRIPRNFDVDSMLILSSSEVLFSDIGMTHISCLHDGIATKGSKLAFCRGLFPNTKFVLLDDQQGNIVEARQRSGCGAF